MTQSPDKTQSRTEKTECMGHQGVQLPISFLICGMEHSGTTLASDIFREHPRCESGFECGALLCESPSDFPKKSPFYRNTIKGWEISENDLNAACQTDNFADFYTRLISHSRLFSDQSRDIVFDKTPRYITRVKLISDLFNIPIIAMIKDPRAIAASDFKRTGSKEINKDKWYESWLPTKLTYMRTANAGYAHAQHNSNCIIIRLEDLCLNLEQTATRMFNHVGLDFSTRFLSLRRKRYSNTRNRSVDASTCVSWMEDLPQSIASRICEDFAEFDSWFYDFH
jgi:hypothetical protein